MMIHTRILLVVSLFLCLCIGCTVGSIVQGFGKQELPTELQDIPNIAATVRQYHSDYTFSKSSRPKRSSSVEQESVRNLKDAKATKSATAAPVAAPTLESARLGSSQVAELSFVILMDELGYSSLPVAAGTRFAFSGRLATDEYQVGTSSGTCTIGSDVQTNFAFCNFYLTFNTDGDLGSGTVTLSGNTDDVGGYLQVTGTGQDLEALQNGYANLVFDPTGSPIMYLLIHLG